MFSLSFWASALLTVLNIWASADAQNLFLEQPSSPVIASIGGSAILPCRSKTALPPGPVKWYKGTGPKRQLIFSSTESYPRVQRVINKNGILDICIRNITSEDEGVYYCVKCRKSDNKELSSKGGTRLIVDTQDMSIEQPLRFVTTTIGGSAILPCRSKTDLPSGPVKWYKGTGPNRELIFSDTGLFTRVQKVNNINRVLDIRIRNVTREDEGVYYCVKIQISHNKELSSKSGTRLIVGQSQSSSGVLIAATAGSLSLVLTLLVLCCYFKRWKGQSPCLARSEASKKNKPQREPTENKETIYTDLQPTGKNHESDYATIHVQ